VDIAMVHDPAMAQPLSGEVPLVLAGHLHHREVSILPAPVPPVPDPSASPSVAPSAPPSTAANGAANGAAGQAPVQTRLMVEGSTGGAGLRGLEGEEPTPLSLSVLYFDEKHQLKAYDDIQLGGTGESNVEMQRNVIGAIPEPTPSQSSSSSSPSPSPSSVAPSPSR
jgi:hypothetical protein